MLYGHGGNSAPCLLLDPITARQFIDRGGFDTKAKLIRWIHETREDAGRALLGPATGAELHLPARHLRRGADGELASRPSDELIPIFQEKDINVVVVGGEANGYWQIMGANYRKTVSIDAWR